MGEDDAISPAVGVMLMLAVSLVLVGAVAGFASNSVTETSVMPIAVLETDVHNDDLFFKSIGGQPVDLSKVTISIYNRDGDLVKFFESPGLDNMNVGRYLEAGESLNLGKIPISKGEIGTMVAKFDGIFVIYDKNVKF